MITAADDIFIDLSTSCTKNVAVAKLLGWMQGPIRRKYINIEEDGISEEQLPYLHILDEPVADQLLELRKSAQRRLDEAFENDASDDILAELQGKVEYFDSQIHLAAKYFRDIDDELAKGDSSELRIDLESTNKTGVPHIAISTLERWSKKRYRDNPNDADEEVDEDESSQISSSGKDKFNNICVTFGFLIKAFSETNTLYSCNDHPNAKQIAIKLEKLAMNANKGDVLNGQDQETIRKFIREALKRKKAKLDGE